MTKFGLTLTVTCLLLSIVHSSQTPRCDSIGYGRPQPDSCTELISDSFPQANVYSRYFGLKTSSKPPKITRAQFARRVALPVLRENGQWSSRSKVCCGLLTVVLEGCKIAFLAIRFVNGSVSYDTTSWADMRNEADRLQNVCGTYPPTLPGGNVVVGEFNIFHTSHMAYTCMQR